MAAGDAARYWVDADGQRHELEFENDSLMINNATSFTLQNIVRNEGDNYCEGGALFLGGGQSIIHAETVSLVGNKVIASGRNSEETYAEGGAIESYGSLIFTGCKQINITGNAAISQCIETEEDPLMPFGSAINVNGGMLEFKDNDKVVIRGNYIAVNDIVDLCAIDTSGPESHVAFETRAGQEVICYDGMSVDGILFINTNTLDTGKWDTEYTGTVTFTGEDTEELLKAIKGKAPTKLEIENSRTITASEIYVHAGKLVLNQVTMSAAVDIDFYDYHLDGGELNYGQFYSTEDAEVQVINSTIETCWYRWGGYEGDVLIEQRAGLYMGKASFRGHNTLKANYIVIGDTWTFHVQAENAEQAVLSIEFNNTQLVSKASPVIGSEGSSTFNISVANGLANGKYKLLEFDTKLGEWKGIDEVTLAGAASGKIAKDSGTVYYTIGSDNMLTLWFNYSGGSAAPAPEQPAARPATTLTWGAGSGAWAAGSGAGQWSGSVSDLNYYDGDSVVFSSAANVTISSVVLPADVLVSHAEGVVVLQSSEGGQISGKTKLTKTGAGELALNLANAYTGGTVVKEGRLTLGNEMALGLGAVQLEGGVLDMGGHAVQNEVRVAGAATISGGAAFAGDLALENAALSGELAIRSGKTLRAADSTLHGSLTLESGVDAQVEGSLTLAAGSKLVTTGAQSIRGGELVLAGGTLQLADTLTVGSLSTAAETSVLLDLDTLRSLGKMDVISAADLSAAEPSLLNFTQLTNTRFEQGMSGSSIWVQLNGAKLTWQPGASGVWGLKEEGGEWATDADDHHFYDMDDVSFESAGEVQIVGTVAPGSMYVKGNGDTSFVGAGSIAGEGNLIKVGAGTLNIATDNSSYRGVVNVREGTLVVSHDHALGKAAVSVYENATFNGGGHRINNKITFHDNSTITNADGASDVVFSSFAKVSGSYTLAVGNRLTVGSTARFLSGDLTFAGGVLSLEGSFYLDGNYHFAPDQHARSAEGSLTTIDLSGRTDIEFRYGEGYGLIRLDGDGDTASHFTLSGLSDEMLSRSSLEYVYDEESQEGWLVLFFEHLGDDIAAALNSNQLAVYSALSDIDEVGEAEGELAEMLDALFSTDDPAAVRAMLDRLSGAELATAMISQLEGNMAHLRRIRANMGSGQRLDSEGKNTAYITGFDTQNHVDADGGKPGIKRTEWGGSVGYERYDGELAVYGIALTSGSATVRPTGGESYDEDSLRLDFYSVVAFDARWSNILSLGFGMHEFNITRSLPGGYTASSSPEGYSVNFQDEISYTWKINEQNSIQPFAAVEVSANVLPAFSESGAGSASLESYNCFFTAVDISLGARYIRSFRAASGRTGQVSVQAAIVMRQVEGDSEMELNFAGAPEQRFKVDAATTDSMGFNLGASVLYPISKHAAVTASANAILRGGAEETGASVGLRLSF